MQLLITSHLIAAKQKSSTVEVNHLERAYKLFLDQARSVQFLQSNEYEFISGNEWESKSDGEVSMQEIEA